MCQHYALQTASNELWNLAISQRPHQSRLVVSLTGVQPAGSSTEAHFDEWAIEDDRYAVSGKHPVHVVIQNDSGHIQVFINGHEADLLRTAAVGQSDTLMYDLQLFALLFTCL